MALRWKTVRSALVIGGALAVISPAVPVAGAQVPPAPAAAPAAQDGTVEGQPPVPDWPTPSGVAGAPALPGQQQCAPPEPGAGPQAATAADVGIDQA